MLGSSGIGYNTTPQKQYPQNTLSRSTIFSSPQTSIYSRGPPVSSQPITIYSSPQQPSRTMTYSVLEQERRQGPTHAGPVLTHFGRGSPPAKVNESASPNISADLSSSMIGRRVAINPLGSYYSSNPGGRSDTRLVLFPTEPQKAPDRPDQSSIVQETVAAYTTDLELTLQGLNDNMLKTLATSSANLLRETESDIQTELEYPDLVSKFSHPASSSMTASTNHTVSAIDNDNNRDTQSASAAELRFAIQDVRREVNSLLKVLRSDQQAQLATSNSLFEMEHVLRDRLQGLKRGNDELTAEIERLKAANKNEQYESRIRLEENGRKQSEEFWRDILLYFCLDDPRQPQPSNPAWWRDVRELAESLRMQYYQKKGILFLAKTRQAELRGLIEHTEEQYLAKLCSLPV